MALPNGVALHVAEYAKTLSKGSQVVVQGAVRSRDYEKDGVKHHIVELRADSVGKFGRALCVFEHLGSDLGYLSAAAGLESSKGRTAEN